MTWSYRQTQLQTCLCHEWNWVSGSIVANTCVYPSYLTEMAVVVDDLGIDPDIEPRNVVALNRSSKWRGLHPWTEESRTILNRIEHSYKILFCQQGCSVLIKTLCICPGFYALAGMCISGAKSSFNRCGQLKLCRIALAPCSLALLWLPLMSFPQH